MSIRHAALTAALGLAVMGSAHADDLVQIYHEARASDPVLAGAEATKLAIDENVDQARSTLLPQIAASLSFSRNYSGFYGEQFVGNPFTGEQVLVNGIKTTSKQRAINGQLTQSLVDVSKWTTLKATKAQAQAGNAIYDAAQQALLIRVATTYFGVLTAEDALRFAEANEKALARQLDQAQQRFDVGLSAITDVNDAKATHDAAVANVIAAQNAVYDAREAVRQLTSKEPGGLRKLRDALPLDKPNPENPESWVDLALKENPTISADAFQLDAANATINTARAGHLPTLDAVVNVGRSPTWGDTRYGGLGSVHNSTDPRWGNNVGVTLSVPIFTGGFTSSRVRQAIYNRDNAQDILEQQRRLVIRDTRSFYRAVFAGVSQVEALRQAVISAQSSLDATQAGYDVGTRTIVDVLLSQQQLLQAQSNYSQGRHSFVLNGLQLKQSAGVIDLKDLEAVNALLD